MGLRDTNPLVRRRAGLEDDFNLSLGGSEDDERLRQIAAAIQEQQGPSPTPPTQTVGGITPDILKAAQEQSDQVGRREVLNIGEVNPRIEDVTNSSGIGNISTIAQQQQTLPESGQQGPGATESLIGGAGLLPAGNADVTVSPTENFLGSITNSDATKRGSGTTSFNFGGQSSSDIVNSPGFGEFGNMQLPTQLGINGPTQAPPPTNTSGGLSLSGPLLTGLAAIPVFTGDSTEQQENAAIGSIFGSFFGPAGATAGGLLAGSLPNNDPNPREQRAAQLANHLTSQLEGGFFISEGGDKIKFGGNQFDIREGQLSSEVRALADPIADALANGNEEDRADIASALASSITEASAGDEDTALANTVRAMRALGISVKDVSVKLRRLFDKGAIDNSRRGQYLDKLRKLYSKEQEMIARGRRQAEEGRNPTPGPRPGAITFDGIDLDEKFDLRQDENFALTGQLDGIR